MLEWIIAIVILSLCFLIVCGTVYVRTKSKMPTSREMLDWDFRAVNKLEKPVGWKRNS